MLIKNYAFQLLIVLAASIAQAATPREWSSENGRFSVVASLEELEEDSITLRNSKGKTIRVEIAKLSEADRDFLSNLRETKFEIDGVGAIGAPSTKHKWELLGKETIDNFSVETYRCMVPGTTEVLTMSVSTQTAATGRERSAQLLGAYNGFMTSYLNAGLRPAFAVEDRPKFDPSIGDTPQYSLKIATT